MTSRVFGIQVFDLLAYFQLVTKRLNHYTKIALALQDHDGLHPNYLDSSYV